MVTWRVRLGSNKKAKEGGIAFRSYDRVPFERTRRKHDAVKAYEAAKDSVDEWGVLELLGFYITLFEKRFRRYLSTSIRPTATDLWVLANREGMKRAVDSVRFIFSDRMKWVTSNQAGFLAGKNTYERFVAVQMDERKGGEQAEWRGKYGGVGVKVGAYEVKL